MLDNKRISRIFDSSIKAGVVGLGTGWNPAYFDNLEIK
jgi:hypothetical protein